MAPRVLLLGGHGKISQILTPLVLSRSWQLTSVIRDPTQKSTIIALGKDQPGTLDVLVSSLEDIKTPDQAQSIISSASPNYIIWSAGAGGKGGPERTKAVDQDACIAFIRAAASMPTVKKFLLVSYIGSRSSKAPWWSDDEWAACQEVNNGVLRNYYPAKLAADQCLTASYPQENKEQVGICLRPGSLTDDEGEGKVSLGKTAAKGRIRRGDVARVAVDLLASKSLRSCWLDLLEGAESIQRAVQDCVEESTDCVEGEDVQAMSVKWR